MVLLRILISLRTFTLGYVYFKHFPEKLPKRVPFSCKIRQVKLIFGRPSWTAYGRWYRKYTSFWQKIVNFPRSRGFTPYISRFSE